MSKQPMLDMFKRVLPAIDMRSKMFYTNLSDEEKKGFSPWLVQRYLSSVESTRQEDIDHYLIMTNEIVNLKDIKDPDLLWKLMSMVGIGKVMRHPYVAPSKGKRKKENVLKIWLKEKNASLNKQEIDILFDSLDKISALNLLEQYQVKDKDLIQAANDL